ncbi:hypothetical protein BY996DRAFT_8687408 [Phakopsora pachyrhizi]|nr:hypothetical protein BY996DRAFT_8687408 [Phakopsora pachyrhizi]
MIFRKSITYLCLVAMKLLSISAAFSKGSPFKTCMDTAEGARTENPYSSQNNLVSLVNSTPLMEKQSQAEHRINLLSTNEDITPHSLNNKRNYKEAFEMRDARTEQPSDIVKDPSFSSPLLSDWGDDLMFSATEWDVYPTYSIDSHSAGTQHNLASALVGLEHDYHDFYSQKLFLLENDLEWVHQPEYLGTINRMGSNGAVESAVPESHYIRQSSINANLPLNSITMGEPTAGLVGNRQSALIKNIILAQQGEARELQEKQSLDEVFENPHSFHFDHNPDVLQSGRAQKPQNNIVEEPDMQVSEEQLPQILYSQKTNRLDKKDVPQMSRSSSSSDTVGRPNMISDIAKNQSVVTENKTERFYGSEKLFKDVIDVFKLQLQDLSNLRSTKSSLSLFLETLDSYTDNISTHNSSQTKKMKTLKDSKIYSQNTFIRRFLGHNEISISRSLIDKLHNDFQKFRKEGGKNSNTFFLKLINGQIKLNGNENFYILDKQLKHFFNSHSSHFKVESIVLQDDEKDKNWYLAYLAKTFWTAMESMPWEDISTPDNKLSLFEKRQLHQKERRTKKLGVDYGVLPNQRFNIRKPFFVYSTLINKVYCSGEKDLKNKFISRQKAAMEFFDMVLGLIEIDNSDTANYFIRNENLPLSEELKETFLVKKSSLKLQKYKFNFRMVNGDRNKIDITWRFISLWLAKEKPKYYKEIYCCKDFRQLHFKQFFSSLFFYILKS